ncbi:MAG: response regulator transcription factor [Planctomycetes bacterium]|nr:response regulator transcription factor [Planctomycetota bacterium]
MATTRVLIVEPESNALNSMIQALQPLGMEVLVAADGWVGLNKARTHLPEMVVLNLSLPSLTGFDVCRELRAGIRTRNIPIVAVSDRHYTAEEIASFDAGADEFIVRPFNAKVFLHRVNAVFARSERTAFDDIIEQHGVRMDRRRHEVAHGRTTINLTKTEFRLLETFLRQPGRTFSRRQLVVAALGEDSLVGLRTIDAHVKSLRKKIARVTESRDFVETVHGVGYRLREETPHDASERSDDDPVLRLASSIFEVNRPGAFAR